MKNKRRTRNVLELHDDGRWFENGRMLRRKDYIYRADCLEGSSILSKITNEFYRLRGSNGRVVV